MHSATYLEMKIMAIINVFEIFSFLLQAHSGDVLLEEIKKKPIHFLSPFFRFYISVRTGTYLDTG